MAFTTMDAFSSGSELSSADEASGDERVSAPSRAERTEERRARSASNTDEKETPQPKRAKLEDRAEAEKPRPKPKPPAATPRATPPTSDDPLNIDAPRQARQAQKPNEPAFGRNMSGWDQLFGPIAATPKPEPRAKDQTPEQRAAAAEARAKEREAEAKQRSAREKEAREKEAQEKEAQARAAREAAAREAARPPPPPRPQDRRPQSVSADELAEYRRRLRPALDGKTPQLDLLASCRVINAFEEAMGHERRHLRASRFGAGLHHLGESKSAGGGAPPNGGEAAPDAK